MGGCRYIGASPTNALIGELSRVLSHRAEQIVTDVDTDSLTSLCCHQVIGRGELPRAPLDPQASAGVPPPPPMPESGTRVHRLTRQRKMPAHKQGGGGAAASASVDGDGSGGDGGADGARRGMRVADQFPTMVEIYADRPDDPELDDVCLEDYFSEFKVAPLQ